MAYPSRGFVCPRRARTLAQGGAADYRILTAALILGIPDDTAIPHWAYLNVTSGTGTWDESASEAVVGQSLVYLLMAFHSPTIVSVSDQPESTGIKPPVATLSTSTGTSNGAGEVSTSTSTSSHSSGGGSNAGAIAGGVVGGLAALGVLAALAVWFFMKKKRSKVPPSSAFVNGYQTSTDPDHLKYDHPPVSAGPSTPPPVMYNPSDPSTFPTALHDPSIGTGYPQTLYDPHAPRRGQYSGAPEI